MPEKIAQRLNQLSDKNDAQELRFLFEAMFDGINALAAKLDADATVTDTDYAATFAEFVAK